MDRFAKRTVTITLVTTQGMLGEGDSVWAPLRFQIWLRVCLWVGWLCVLKEHARACVRTCVVCILADVSWPEGCFSFVLGSKYFGFSSSLNPLGFRDRNCGGVVGDRDLIRALLSIGE